MHTLITESVEEAAEFIRNGEVVAFPTETVYGLGANVFDEAAVSKIFDAKGRPKDNPLIAHIFDRSQLLLLASRLPESASLLCDRFMPGPLTVIVPKHAQVPLTATTGLETIGVRMPRHERALDFLRACGVPLVAPSANLSGRPSPTTWEAVRQDLDGRIACILKGEPSTIGLESTVVDCTGDCPVVLRAGGISLEEIQAIIPSTVSGRSAYGEPVRSPGMKYRHYAPKAKVIVCPPGFIPDQERLAYIGISRPSEGFMRVQACKDLDEYASRLFGFFRSCDDDGVVAIYCQEVEEKGLGLALMDRIRKAASGK